jgi:perosamine synthetase
MKKVDIDKISILPNSTIKQAMQAINNGEMGVVFVVDKKGFLNNLITDGDIRRALLKGYGLQSIIDVVENANPIVAKIDTPLKKISKMFSDKIRIIPIVDEKNKIIDVHFKDKRSYIPVTNPFFDENEIELLNECIISGWISSGGVYVNEFEKIVAKHTGTKYAISCSSGTSGLHLALMAHNIGPGDEVIVPSLTFIATANAVTYTGAKPIFVDSDLKNWNIDPKLIESSITDKTKAIIPVHLYGLPADMDAINHIAKKYNLIVIEDASEAQGAKYKNKMVGTLGDAAVFSFFGNKIITTGEGGMIVTNNQAIAEKCEILRDHGMSKSKRYWHNELGYNYRMTNMQAAIGVAQMKKIGRIIKKKRRIASEYKKNLKSIPGIIFPAEEAINENVFWLFTIVIDENSFGMSSNDLMYRLKEYNIDTRPIFYPLHTQPIYNNNQSLPKAEKIHAGGVTLPSAYDLKDDEIKKICDIIKSYAK